MTSPATSREVASGIHLVLSGWLTRLSSFSRDQRVFDFISYHSDEANMHEDGIAGLVSIFLISHLDAVRPQTIAGMKYV